MEPSWKSIEQHIEHLPRYYHRTRRLSVVSQCPHLRSIPNHDRRSHVRLFRRPASIFWRFELLDGLDEHLPVRF
jgi:hypothetical protein